MKFKLIQLGMGLILRLFYTMVRFFASRGVLFGRFVLTNLFSCPSSKYRTLLRPTIKVDLSQCSNLSSEAFMSSRQGFLQPKRTSEMNTTSLTLLSRTRTEVYKRPVKLTSVPNHQSNHSISISISIVSIIIPRVHSNHPIKRVQAKQASSTSIGAAPASATLIVLVQSSG